MKMTAEAINDIEIEARKAFHAGKKRIDNPYWKTEWEWKCWADAWLNEKNKNQ